MNTVTMWDVIARDETQIPIKLNTYRPNQKIVADATAIVLQFKSDLLYPQSKIKITVEGRTETVENIYG